jgi:uncharacterized integral membrane protein
MAKQDILLKTYSTQSTMNDFIGQALRDGTHRKMNSQLWRHWLSMLAGAVLLLVALWLIIPVAVNLPVSWPGGVLLVLCAVSGAVLVLRAARGLRRRSP